MRIDSLAEAGLVVEDGAAESTGGRRATFLRFASGSGVVAVADLGINIARLAVADLGGEIVVNVVDEQPMDLGPDDYLGWMSGRFDELLEDAGRNRSDLRGIGVGLPGPVELVTGRSIAPPSMPGWDGYPAAQQLNGEFEVPVLVDNDVNLMAWGEYTRLWRDTVSNFLMIKIADAGIGCGIVAGDRIHHGAQGSAGAIGHIRVQGYNEWVCRCGNAGCLGAAVGGEGMAKRLTLAGHSFNSGREVAQAALNGDLAAIQEIRSCGRALGEVLSGVVNFFNPEVIVVGGVVAQAHEQLITGMREVIYQRCLPLALTNLKVVPAGLGDDAGIIGAAAMTIDHVMSPSAVDQMLKAQDGASGGALAATM
jgi:predicted NBD/HSP70 family sugar kinase